MTISAKIIADSISTAGKCITTMQLCYPRFIHAEFMTHRVFSRNASSSRAIPVAKMIEQVRTNPAMPIHWGKNQAGMQANEELAGHELWQVQEVWKNTANIAANYAETMTKLGLHKQVANRILEPFQHIHVVVTSTEWDNFFELRAHKDAQPEIQELAIQMRNVINASKPTPLDEGEWHLPYVTDDDWTVVGRLLKGMPPQQIVDVLRKVSAARCCRVSYLKHDGSASDIEEDLALCDRLVGAKPLHASPFEHQATPDTKSTYDHTLIHPNSKEELVSSGEEWDRPHLHGNFIGWVQHRKLIEDQFK